MPDTPARPTLLQRAVLWILHALMFYAVVLHPVLLMARFQPDDVVHYGFLRWIAVVLVLYWAASQLFFAERPADTRPGRQTLAVTAGILLVLGVFTPIVSFPFVGDVDFFRAGYGDGYILLAMAGLSMALAVTGRWKQVLVPGLGALAVVLWTFLSVQDTVSQARSGVPATLAGNPHEGLAASVMQAIEWKWGWLLLFAGSGLLVYSAARRDDLADEASPFAPVGMEDEPAAAPFAEPAGAKAAAAGPAGASAQAEAAAAWPTDETSAPSEPTAAGSADASAQAEATAAGPAGEAEAGVVEAAGGETAAPADETRSAPTGAAAEAAATPESAAAEGPVTAAAETPAKPPETAAEPAPPATAGGATAANDATAAAKQSETAAEPAPPATAGDALADGAPPAAQPAEAKASTPTPEAAAAEPAAAESGAPPAPTAVEESEAAANESAAKTETAGTAEAAPAAESTAKRD